MSAENRYPAFTEDQFKASVYAKYKQHFDYYYQLVGFAQTSLISHTYLVADHYGAALQFICPRAYKSFDTIRRLCEIAHCEDAGVILRCLLNLMAVTRWISLEPQKRAKKYLGWYWIEVHAVFEKDPERFSAKAAADVVKRYDAEKSQFEFKNRKGNLEFARQWYEPDAKSIRDIFTQVDLEEHYDEAYKPLSGIEHSDVMAHFATFAKAEIVNGERKLEIQSDLFVPEYLRNGFQYFADIFALCNRTLAMADGKQLQDIVALGMDFYQADKNARETRL